MSIRAVSCGTTRWSIPTTAALSTSARAGPCWHRSERPRRSTGPASPSCGSWPRRYVRAASTPSCSAGTRRYAPRAPRHRTRSRSTAAGRSACRPGCRCGCAATRSEEHTSELQSRENLVCRLLLEKKKKKKKLLLLVQKKKKKKKKKKKIKQK